MAASSSLTTPDEASAILAKLEGSFLGFYDTLSWYVGDNIREAEIAALCDALNQSGGEIGGSCAGTGYAFRMD
jgi:alpha-D-ribose 1-methylphosphonate 5-triphosphate synthase subunit PhnG